MGTNSDDDDATDDGRSAVVDSFSLPSLSESVLICITCSQQQSMIILYTSAIHYMHVITV